MKKSIVLLSGGLDSSVCLVQALKETRVELCITFNYGQRAAQKEIAAASAIAKYYQVRHQIIFLPFLKEITRTALVATDVAIPKPAPKDLNDYNKARLSATKVWVPNRNSIFINIGAAYAESLHCDLIIAGFNREEAQTFPDNSKEFVATVNQALKFSTLNHVQVISYTQKLIKKEIALLARELGIPWQYIWSCYLGEETMCGKCESCLRLQQALDEAGMKIITSN